MSWLRGSWITHGHFNAHTPPDRGCDLVRYEDDTVGDTLPCTTTKEEGLTGDRRRAVGQRQQVVGADQQVVGLGGEGVFRLSPSRTIPPAGGCLKAFIKIRSGFIVH